MNLFEAHQMAETQTRMAIECFDRAYSRSNRATDIRETALAIAELSAGLKDLTRVLHAHHTEMWNRASGVQCDIIRLSNSERRRHRSHTANHRRPSI